MLELLQIFGLTIIGFFIFITCLLWSVGPNYKVEYNTQNNDFVLLRTFPYQMWAELYAIHMLRRLKCQIRIKPSHGDGVLYFEIR